MSGAVAADPCKVYVGNLSWSTDEDGLSAHFSSVGAVASAEIMRNRDGTRSRGYGYVTFADADSVAKAIAERHESELDGRALRVEGHKPSAPRDESAPRRRRREPAEEGKVEASTKLFVGNLPFESTADDLSAVFASVDGVKSVDLKTRSDGQSKGFGYVTFDTAEQATAAAAALAGTEVGGRPLRVEPRRPPARRTRGSGAGAGAGSDGAAATGRGRRRRAPREPEDESKVSYTGDSKKVFVGNLPWTTTPEELTAAFSGFGAVTDSSIQMSRDGSRSRGFGYVLFAEADQAAAAVAGTHAPIEGRELRVELERRRVVEE